MVVAAHAAAWQRRPWWPVGGRWIVRQLSVPACADRQSSVSSWRHDATRLRAHLVEFSPYLPRQFADDRVWLYEIVAFPGW